jgi:hypothetical protein
MAPQNPVEHVEELVGKMHSVAKVQAKPVLKRYPLLFSLLIAFSLAAVFHGFDLLMEEYSYFREHPLVLIGIGVLGLLITGSLYKKLSG